MSEKTVTGNKMTETLTQDPTKLILVEGLPGSGKTTTARHIADFLLFNGVDYKLYDEGGHEESVGFFDPTTPTYAEDLQNGWQTFVDAQVDSTTVAILEAHYWQNTAFYMYHMAYKPETIISIIQSLTEMIAPLNPILIYLVQADIETRTRKTFEMRGEAWTRRIIKDGLDNQAEFSRLIQHFEESQAIADRLYDQFPHRKLKIHDPHADWVDAYDQIHIFLRQEWR